MFVSILVLSGIIMVLVTAGAPPFCRAEYEGWSSVRVTVVRSSYLAGDASIRRAEYE